MLPGMNPRKMQQMMRKMGVAQVEIPATEVIIRTPEYELVISDPQVSRVKMMGQETFQISGQVNQRSLSTEVEISSDDIQTVIDQANVSESVARAALKKTKGDIAQAIMDLQDEDSEDSEDSD